MAEYAGAIHRILAVIIDHIILAVVTIIIAIPLGLSSMVFSMARPDPFAMAANAVSWIAFGIVAVIIWILYFPYFESRSGQTPGKRVMGIKVTKENGKALTFGDALIRTVFRIIDFLPVAYIIGLIVILVSQKKQRIGDMAAKTIVVKA
jgi:uncharacterized RDD family membrane protein YckC